MRLFVKHRTPCAGCPSAPFHTLEVAPLHDSDVVPMLSQLNEIMAVATERQSLQEDSR